MISLLENNPMSVELGDNANLVAVAEMAEQAIKLLPIVVGYKLSDCVSDDGLLRDYLSSLAHNLQLLLARIEVIEQYQIDESGSGDLNIRSEEPAADKNYRIIPMTGYRTMPANIEVESGPDDLIPDPFEPL